VAATEVDLLSWEFIPNTDWIHVPHRACVCDAPPSQCLHTCKHDIQRQRYCYLLIVIEQCEFGYLDLIWNQN